MSAETQSEIEQFKHSDYVNTETGRCTECSEKINIHILGFGHGEKCWVKYRMTNRYYEKAFVSVWNLLVLIEANIVDAKALGQLRSEVSHLVFGYQQDPDLMLKASVEALAMQMSGLTPEEV